MIARAEVSMDAPHPQPTRGGLLGITAESTNELAQSNHDGRTTPESSSARGGSICNGLGRSLDKPRWLIFAMFAFLSSQGRFMSVFLSERGLTNAQAPARAARPA
jgi:hypothetical protein